MDLISGAVLRAVCLEGLNFQEFGQNFSNNFNNLVKNLCSFL
jgi:hypothetical protein